MDRAAGSGALDALTGLGDQRLFAEALKAEVDWAHRFRRPLSLVLFDLVEFKRINDVRGHMAGDAVLRAVGDGLRAAFPPPGIACRLGGDEFGVILPGHDLEDASALAAELGGRVAPEVTLSTGAAAMRPDDDVSSFLDRAVRDFGGGPGGPPGDGAGVREPRRPRPPLGGARAALQLDDAA